MRCKETEDILLYKVSLSTTGSNGQNQGAADKQDHAALLIETVMGSVDTRKTRARTERRAHVLHCYPHFVRQSQRI